IQDEAYYQAQVGPYLDEDNIVYVGPVGPERRDQLLQGAYALLHPIYFAEPFGLSVVEAMACGTPVVAFNRGSMPEVIKDGQTGFLVNNIDEAVDKLPAIAGLERSDGRRWVQERFSKERMVADYIVVYEAIIAQR
ncbi:MAG: glycosyltransferase, partial [Firmicutes bacterium]|nr:glycosyltransferase [Bacillota bacterium]